MTSESTQMRFKIVSCAVGEGLITPLQVRRRYSADVHRLRTVSRAIMADCRMEELKRVLIQH